MLIARQFVVRGRVQGVGFRFFTERAARAEGLSGWVRSRDDGCVEALVEGDRDAVDWFERQLRRGPRRRGSKRLRSSTPRPAAGRQDFRFNREKRGVDAGAQRAIFWYVPDFPKPGILFYDITTLLQDPDGFRMAIDAMTEPHRHANNDTVVGIESRGFVFGAAIADRLRDGFAPVRKPGKLPSRRGAPPTR